MLNLLHNIPSKYQDVPCVPIIELDLMNYKIVTYEISIKTQQFILCVIGKQFAGIIHQY